MPLSKCQKVILNKILDQYEKSKTYIGENKVNQTFSIRPDSVYKDYYLDTADIDEIRDFENDCKELKNQKLILIEYRNNEIRKMIGVEESFDQYYSILKRENKFTLILNQLNCYRSYLGINSVIDAFINTQIEKLESGHKAEYDLQTAKNILALLKFIYRNHEEILERELSIAVLGDSKLFENSYRKRICKIIMKYDHFEDIIEGINLENERNHVLLEEFNIYPNPSYVYLKGKARIIFDDGRIIESKDQEPIALSSKSIAHLRQIDIIENKLMTVENLSSFHRISDASFFYIYLAGYHNRAKQQLLKRIIEHNSNVSYYHFGDIDPDGLFILDNLNRKLGVEFILYKMDISYLKKYNDYTKTLEKNDIEKANTLIMKGIYTDLCLYMLEHNCKLEQEIISWNEKE